MPDAVTLGNWLNPPFNRAAFQRVDQLLPVAPIGRGAGPARELKTVLQEGLIDEAFLERTSTDGLLVLRGETIVAEHYRNGLTPATRHSLMSVSKSIGAMAAGCLVASGALDLQARVEAVIPELAGSAYAGATVQQVLDMAVALRFDQTYVDPRSDVQTEDRASGWRPKLPGDPPHTKAFLATLQPSGAHGSRFQYCSATTDVMAWLMERVSGRPYPELVGELVWSQVGAEHDAFVTLDSAGFPYACAGMCATLRDLARFGRLVLDGGWNAGWIEATRHGAGSRIASAPEYEITAGIFPDGVYHNQWWTTRNARGSFYAVGIFGQYLWLDPVADVVIAKLSSLPLPLTPESSLDHFREFRIVEEAAAS